MSRINLPISMWDGNILPPDFGDDRPKEASLTDTKLDADLAAYEERHEKLEAAVRDALAAIEEALDTSYLPESTERSLVLAADSIRELIGDDKWAPC